MIRTHVLDRITLVWNSNRYQKKETFNVHIRLQNISDAGCPRCSRALAWYQQALGATELWNLGPVVGMEINGAPFFLAQPANNGWNSPTEIGTTTVRVEVFCDDPDAVIARALAAGASGSLDNLQNHYDAPWGRHRQGHFFDPFGHLWLVGDYSPLNAFPA
jgi:PhnB protein